MAEFCEGCPDAGECNGRIDRLKIMSSVTQGSISQDGRTASFSFERGVPQGPTDMSVRYIDAMGGTSEPVTVHGDSASDAEYQAGEYINKIGRCMGPAEVKKFFGLVTRSVCSAPQ
jgi:hypothetical protein